MKRLYTWGWHERLRDSQYCRLLKSCSFDGFYRSNCRSSLLPCADGSAVEAQPFDLTSLLLSFEFSPLQQTAVSWWRQKHSLFCFFLALRRKEDHQFSPVKHFQFHILLGISGNGLVDLFKFSSLSFSDALNTDELSSCCFIWSAFNINKRLFTQIYFRFSYKLPKLRTASLNKRRRRQVTQRNVYYERLTTNIMYRWWCESARTERVEIRSTLKINS